MAGNVKGAVKAAETKRRGARRDSEGFTVGERAFVTFYTGPARGNGTEAEFLARGGKGSRLAARRYASEILKRPHVIAAIEEATAARMTRLNIDADDILRDLSILKAQADCLTTSVQSIRVRREIIKDMGDHIRVGAFRRQVGLSAPNGGPIETADVAALAQLTDEELDQIERARAIIDRIGGKTAEVPNGGGDPGGEGEEAEGA